MGKPPQMRGSNSCPTRTLNSWLYQEISKDKNKCKLCKKSIKFKTARHRTTALLNEPDENAWMAFVYQDMTSPQQRLFQASHRCHTRIPNDCMNTEHVFLETSRTSADRDLHHRARKPCDHERPCLGVGILPLPRSA